MRAMLQRVTEAALLADEGVPVETGRFAASMTESLVDDGPFTIWMDSREA